MHDPRQRDHIVSEVAERAAREIRERAEAEARRLTEERARMSEAFLGEQRRALDELDRATAEHFGIVKAQTEQLLFSLRRTIEKAREPLPFDPGPAVERAPEPPAVTAPPPEPVPAVAVAPPPPAAQASATPAPDLAPSPPAPQPPAPRPAAPEPPQPAPDAAVAAVPLRESSEPSASRRGQFVHHSTEATALAAQMAAAGSGREDIIRGLREAFSISEPEPLADEALARYGS